MRPKALLVLSKRTFTNEPDVSGKKPSIIVRPLFGCVLTLHRQFHPLKHGGLESLENFLFMVSQWDNTDISY